MPPGAGDGPKAPVEGVREATRRPTPPAHQPHWLFLCFLMARTRRLCLLKWQDENSGSQTSVYLKYQRSYRGAPISSSQAPCVHAREEACVRAPVNTPVHARTHLLKRVRVHSTWLFATLARSLGPAGHWGAWGLPASLADPTPCIFPPINWDKWPVIPSGSLKASFFLLPFCSSVYHYQMLHTCISVVSLGCPLEDIMGGFKCGGSIEISRVELCKGNWRFFFLSSLKTIIKS